MASCPHDWEIYFAPVHLAMIADWRIPWVQGVWTVLNLSAYQAVVKFNDRNSLFCFMRNHGCLEFPTLYGAFPSSWWLTDVNSQSDRLPEKWPKPNSFRFPRINWSRGLCDSFTAMWSVWYQAKLCVNERQKETFGFLLTRKLSVQEITLARLKMLTVVTIFQSILHYLLQERAIFTNPNWWRVSGCTNREGFLNSSLGFVNKNLLQENMFF